MGNFVRVISLMLGRSLTRTRRDPTWVLIGLFQPVLYLVLFAPLLDGLRMPGYAGSNSLNLFVPGLLIMIALFSTSFAGFSILDDLRTGVVERLRVTPANRFALLLGMVIHDVLVFLAQCLVLTVAAALMGLDASLPGLVVLFVLMGLIGVTMAAFSYGITLIVRDQGALAAMVTTLTQPLLLLSGILLPLTLAPQLLQTLAQINPFAQFVDASRSLIIGQFTTGPIPLAFGLALGMMVLALLWAVRVFRRATA